MVADERHVKVQAREETRRRQRNLARLATTTVSSSDKSLTNLPSSTPRPVDKHRETDLINADASGQHCRVESGEPWVSPVVCQIMWHLLTKLFGTILACRRVAGAGAT